MKRRTPRVHIIELRPDLNLLRILAKLDKRELSRIANADRRVLCDAVHAAYFMKTAGIALRSLARHILCVRVKSRTESVRRGQVKK